MTSSFRKIRLTVIVGEPACYHNLFHIYGPLYLCSTLLARSSLGIQGFVHGAWQYVSGCISKLLD